MVKTTSTDTDSSGSTIGPVRAGDLHDLLTDGNQVVFAEIESVKQLEADDYAVLVKDNGGAFWQASIHSTSGRRPTKGEQWKFMRGALRDEPLEVKDGENVKVYKYHNPTAEKA